MSEEKEAEETTSTCSITTQPQIHEQPQEQIQTLEQTSLSTTQLQAAQIQSAIQGNITAASVGIATTTKIQAIQIQSAQIQMQAPTPSPQGIVPQTAQVQQQQTLTQNNLSQVMSQGPQTTPTHAVQNTLPPQSPQQPQYYVHTSVGTGMQGPPAIAPAPGPQTTATTTVSALHQPLMHHIAPQTLTHPGVSPSPMPQFSPQVQVIQGGIPAGTPYLQQVYQNAQGQIIMPSNLTIQPNPGMGATPIQQGTLNPINSSIQVITAGKPFQGQLAPHMIAGGKPGVIQQGQAAGYGSHPTIPSSVSQTVLIGQLGGQLGVISSQPPNILPAHSSSQKAGDLHKVNNMQAATFGPIQQSSIAWATPGTALHSPTLLTAQNSPIFIRGSQPGQEGLYIQSAPTQPMAPNNTMVQTMSVGPQPPQNKVRSTLDTQQTNIQPKVTSMRPPILPSGAQIRHGAALSSQAGTGGAGLLGQTTGAVSQLGTPRSQVQKFLNKVRGKNASNRMAAASAGTLPQQPQTQIPQQLILQPQTPLQQPTQIQPQQMLSIPNVGTATGPLVMANGSIPALASIQKPLTVAASSAIGTVSNVPQINSSITTCAKPSTPVDQATAQGRPIDNLVTVAVSSEDGSQENCITWKALMPPSVSTGTNGIVNGNVTHSSSATKTVADIPGAASNENNSGLGTPVLNGNGLASDKPSHSVVPQSPSGPPKAMVKPQVLTHVIEGFVIHEASEPFPVNRSSILSDVSKVRNSNASNTATVLPQGAKISEKPTDDTQKEPQKGDGGNRCEVCGKVEIRSKYKKSKRFCSSTCAKRYNVNSAKRIGVCESNEESPGKKTKSDDIIGDSDSPMNGVSQTKTTGELVEGEGELELMDDDLGDTPKVDILKWTVRDVVDFIQNLPGCQDYAEDFELQEIDGQALMLLKADHLMSAMSIKLGPALKICAKIEAMRIDRKEN